MTHWPSCLFGFLLLSISMPVSASAQTASTCWHSALSDCEVTAEGIIPTHFDATAIRFQIQSGYSTEYGAGGALIVEQSVDGSWQSLIEDYRGHTYAFPVEAIFDQHLLHFAGVGSGTAAPNADVLLQFVHADDESGHWQQVDIDSWKTTLLQYLPRHTDATHGVNYDFGDNFWPGMHAQTPLWRDTDANCCPSGGYAFIHFSIEDAVLSVTSVDVTELQP